MTLVPISAEVIKIVGLSAYQKYTSNMYGDVVIASQCCNKAKNLQFHCSIY